MQKALVYQVLRKIERRSPLTIAGLCVYEAVALAFPSKFTPPITKLAHNHKWVLPVFCGIVGVHVWFYDG